MSDHACCFHAYDDVRQTNISINGILAYCCRGGCKNIKLLFGFDGMEEKTHGIVLPFVPTAYVVLTTKKNYVASFTIPMTPESRARHVP